MERRGFEHRRWLAISLGAAMCLAASDAKPAFQGQRAGKVSHGAQKKDKTVYAEDLLATFTGTVRTSSGKNLSIEDEDKKILDFHATRKTEYFDAQRKIRQSDVKPGERVSIDAKLYPDGGLEPVRVRVIRSSTP